MKFKIHNGIDGKFYPVVLACTETGNRDWYIDKIGRIVRLEGFGKNEFNTEKEAEKFLKSWLPQSGWIDKVTVELVAKLGDKNALLASITHWKQIVLAGPKTYREARADGKVAINQDYCSLCQRYGDKDTQCPLKGKNCNGIDCVEEYRKAAVDLSCNEIDGAVSLLNKLITIYNNTYKETKMSLVDDRLVQVDVDISALHQSHQVALKALEVEKQKLLEEKKKSEKYIFQAGDVVENNMGVKRIILRINGELKSFDNNGISHSTGQKDFEYWGYRKIGVMADFIKW